jgi:hypothetical protein
VSGENTGMYSPSALRAAGAHIHPSMHDYLGFQRIVATID